MRILQLIQKQQLRGAEIFASQVGEYIRREGHDVILVSLFEGQAALPFHGKKYCLAASPSSRFMDVAAWRKLNDLIRDFNPDIVQANAGDTLKYAVFSKVIFRWPSKIIFRNANLMSAFLKGNVHRIFNRWLLKRCHHFISVSENCRQDLITIYPEAAGISTTIPVGADPSIALVTAVPRNNSTRGPVFISIGSFVPEKNHDFLLDIFHLYYQRHENGTLWLVGDGKLRGTLEKKADVLGLQDRVFFWGYRSDVISILKSADVFIMPSFIEGLPAVILEAMACNVPVVASAVGGIPEVIEDDVSGVCLKEWSAELYVTKLEALLEREQYRENLVRNARQKFLERFALDKVSREFLIQYQKMIV